MRLLFFLVGVIAVGMLAMPLMWLAVGLAHWAIIGLVIWAAVSLLRGPSPRHWERVRWQDRRPLPPRPPVRPAPPRSVAPREARAPSTDHSLPADVQAKVEQIRRKAGALLQHPESFPLGSESLYIVRATRDDYLPRTLNAFLAVPPMFRDRPLPKAGKTPLQELQEQLNLLDAKLDQVAEDLHNRNADRLLNNRRFLEERFSRVA